MALIEWETGDPLDQIPLNDRSVRKGTESEISAIANAENEEGSLYWNSTEGFIQVQTGGGATDKRGNLTCAPIVADDTEVILVGDTITEKKNFAYFKNSAGNKGNQLTIIAEIKTDNAGTTAHLRIRTDFGGSDDLDLTTTSTSYTVVSGTIDITGKADGRRTVEIFLSDGSGDTMSLRLIEVYAIWNGNLWKKQYK